MAILPRKLTIGSQFKEQTVRAINAIIDYLYSLRLVGDNQTVNITKKHNGIMITAKPSAPTTRQTAAAVETNVTIGDGVAVPCRMEDHFGDPWDLPYQISIYPNGFGDSTVSQGVYALPTTVAFSPPPPTDEPLIAFSTYITTVGGYMEGTNQL